MNNKYIIPFLPLRRIYRFSGARKSSENYRRAIFLIFVCLFIPENVLAYIITVKDTSACQFQNGKYIGTNPLYSTSYEVNLDTGEILEIVDGTKDDAASVNATNFKIISSDNGQIVAVSITSKGEQMFTLKKDGSFHFYQTLYAHKDYPPHKKGDSFSVVSFGNYKVIQGGN